MSNVIPLRPGDRVVWSVDRLTTTLPDGREATVWRSELDGYCAKVGDDVEIAFRTLREAQDWAEGRR